MTVVSNHKDFNKNELQNAKAHLRITDANGAEMGLFYVFSDGTFRFTNGTQVIILGKLNEISPPSAAVSMNSQKITNLAEPEAAQEAATKNYVDLLRQGVTDRVEEPVRVAMNTNVNVASPGTSTFDTVDMSTGTNKRVLLRNQSSGLENDIWIFNGAGAAMTRAPDVSPRDGSLVAVAEGNSAGALFIQQTTPGAGARGSWAQSWTNMGTGATYTNGTGLTLTGSTFALAIPVAIAHGGTGETTAAASLRALGGVEQFSGTLATDGSLLNVLFTHNLNTRKLMVGLREISNNVPWEPDWTYTSLNAITFHFAVAHAANKFEAWVQGKHSA